MTYAGIDLGATHTRVVLADDQGRIRASVKGDTPRGPSGEAVTEATVGLLRGACDEMGVAPETVRAVGIGSIGPLDLAAGDVVAPANLPDEIDRVRLRDPVAETVGSDRVYLHNDTHAGVVGERFYSERNPDDMVYLTISSGIGAGVCVDGNVLSGWDGNVGEIGHLTLDPEGRLPCGCGGRGHWESFCAGSNVPTFARWLHETEGLSTDLPLEDDVDAAAVFELAGEDPLADRTVERMAHWNALGIAALVHAYAPLVVYVGGAVALNNPDLVVDPIADRLDRLVVSNVPDLRLATLGDAAVVKGALASAMTRGTGDRTLFDGRPR